MSGQSPLKAMPLRLPGQTVDDEIVRLRENTLMDHLLFAGGVLLLASMEWFGYLTHSGRHPMAFTLLAVVAIGYVVCRAAGPERGCLGAGTEDAAGIHRECAGDDRGLGCGSRRRSFVAVCEE
jgi:hypothetical protein